MFTNYSSKNRVVSSALQVNYLVERRKDGDTYWYKVTRTATKNYRYVDLEASSAANVQAIMVFKYTRNTRKCISRTLDKTFESITSEITTQRNNNGSYDVIINVNECDSTHSDTIPADPASLFTTENARDYGEGESGIVVTYCSFDAATTRLYVDFYVKGDLVPTPVSDVELWSGGVRYDCVVKMLSQTSYELTSGLWAQERSTGKVKIGDHEAEWSL